MDLKFGKLENSFNILEKEYQTNGEISWSDFNKDQKANKRKVVLVKQKDFENGTLRIKEACSFKLTENISFNPNRPKTWINKDGKVTKNVSEAVKIDPNRELDWWPDFKLEENSEYFEKEVKNAYRLGFFAAITLENEEIILNLNNFTIQQHPEHALQQRFFSVIELADQPFVPKQGPANFGMTIKSSQKVYIKNGTIGLSSHHAIHGNGVNTILIKNVDFVENEVCAVALNGSTDVYLVNLIVKKNRHDIPVLGSYSAGRFLKLFIDKLLDGVHKNNSYFQKSYINLNKELDQAFNSTIFKNETMPEIYENKSGLIDGNYYGIIINPLGVAVNAPLPNRNTPKANESCNIFIKSVSINNVKSKINEIIALKNKDNKILTAPSGGIFQFLKAATIKNNKYYYTGNSLADLQIELRQIINDNQNVKKFVGNFNIDDGMLLWKRNPDSYFEHKYDKFIGKGDLEGIDYEVIGNGDSMFHVNKGTFGLKIDGLNTSVIDNLTISNVQAFGEEGTSLAGNYIKSHPKQNQLLGYRGHLVFGIEINASNDVRLKNVNLDSITSKYGSSYGLSVSGESIKIQVEESLLKDIESCQIPYDFNKSYWPNFPTNSRGIYLANNCSLATKDVVIEGIKDTPDCLIPSKYELYSNIKTL